jgi:hypothetical protein
VVQDLGDRFGTAPIAARLKDESKTSLVYATGPGDRFTSVAHVLTPLSGASGPYCPDYKTLIGRLRRFSVH